MNLLEAGALLKSRQFFSEFREAGLINHLHLQAPSNRLNYSVFGLGAPSCHASPCLGLLRLHRDKRCSSSDNMCGVGSMWAFSTAMAVWVTTPRSQERVQGPKVGNSVLQIHGHEAFSGNELKRLPFRRSGSLGEFPFATLSPLLAFRDRHPSQVATNGRRFHVQLPILLHRTLVFVVPPLDALLQALGFRSLHES